MVTRTYSDAIDSAHGRQIMNMDTKVGKRVSFDIDREVIRCSHPDSKQEFLPADLSLDDRLPFLEPEERRLLSRIQERTYANMIGLVDHIVGTRIVETLFARIEETMAERMPPGYRFFPQHGDVEEFALARSRWSLLALTCHIESFTGAHNRQSSEWLREDASLTAQARDEAVNDFIVLLQGIDVLLLFQADFDVDYFAAICPRAIATRDIELLREKLLSAYRRQYIASGMLRPRFADLLGQMINADQAARIRVDLAQGSAGVPAH